MITAVLNNSGSQLLKACESSMLSLQAKSLSADILLNCFSAEFKSKEKVLGSEFDGSALLDIRDVNDSLEGDEDAYRRLVERHQSDISGLMWRFSRDRAVHEDLVQEVFIQVYMSLGNYKRKAPFKHWLYRMATRVGFGYWRKKGRENKISTVRIEDFDQDKLAGGDVRPNEAGELLFDLLEKLPPRDRLVLTLRFVEQYNIEETASLAGWSTSMVKVQTWRAKGKLKELFEEISQKSEE